MDIIFFGNNSLGLRVAKWLKSEEENIVGLVTHPPCEQKYTQEIRDTIDLPLKHIFTADNLHRSETIKKIKSLKPDIGISVLFGYILRKELISIFPEGIINLHPAYLPYNRGSYPNVWSIVEGTPAGVSLHYIDSGIDTGAIISRENVEIEPVDTGKSLYEKLEEAALNLFKENWPDIKRGQIEKAEQKPNDGTTHTTSDVKKIDEIELDKEYTGKELIDILRSRTFPPHKGAYFYHNGKKVYINVDLEYEEADDT